MTFPFLALCISASVSVPYVLVAVRLAGGIYVFKLEAAPSPSPTTSAPTAIDAPAGNYSGLIKLIEGGMKPINVAATTTIVFDAETTLDSSSDVEIVRENTVVDGAGSSRIFVVDGSILTLRSIELRNGYTALGNGGALSLLNCTFVEIINCVVSDSTDVNGGAASVDSGSVLLIIGSSVIGNHTTVICLRLVLLFRLLTSFSRQRIIVAVSIGMSGDRQCTPAVHELVTRRRDEQALDRCERETSRGSSTK